ncbi:putative methyltransferase C27D7.08c [Termitomyces sp. T112]|nr:putative methyltransferase C27D7.08c [Termitomyces sp. T112]
MHSRNVYTSLLDFEVLARSYPPLSQHLRGRTIDFHDDAAQRCLTQALLKRDFGLELQLPKDRLCPPVPNRLNYVLWIQDIVTELQRTLPIVFRGRTTCTVRGLDIGTGASAIYPLLACSLEPTWMFSATELDDLSYAHAQRNIRANRLSDRIYVVRVESDTNEDGPRFEFDRLFGGRMIERITSESGSDTPTTKDEIEIQFTMCNPPFYSSAAEITDSEARKERSPFGVCTGAPVEMITPGGEVHFVSAMVRESVYGRKEVGVNHTWDNDDDDEKMGKIRRIGKGTTLPADKQPTTSSRKFSYLGPRWYTSMLGQMGSVVEVVRVFKELGITNYAITEFVQGQTRRWAVGWCVDGWRLSDNIARIANPNPTLQRLLPPRNTLKFDIVMGENDALGCLEKVLRSVEDATFTPDDGANPEGSLSSYVVSVTCDTWSRGARRKRKRQQEKAANGNVVSEGDCSPEFVCSIVLRSEPDRNRIQMDVQWLYGKERSLFESFASHVARKLNSDDGG